MTHSHGRRERLFLSLSSALTGYSLVDLQGTGVGGAYLQKLTRKAGRGLADKLLETWNELENLRLSAERLEARIHEQILADDEIGGPARALIKMWYLGQWEPLEGGPAEIVSAEAYKRGLVWDAIGAHPQAANQPGYGSWALPPRGPDGAREEAS